MVQGQCRHWEEQQYCTFSSCNDMQQQTLQQPSSATTAVSTQSSLSHDPTTNASTTAAVASRMIDFGDRTKRTDCIAFDTTPLRMPVSQYPAQPKLLVVDVQMVDDLGAGVVHYESKKFCSQEDAEDLTLPIKQNIHCVAVLHCIDEQGHSVTVRVKDAQVNLFIQVPDAWTAYHCDQLQRYLAKALQLPQPGNLPYVLERRMQLYGWVPDRTNARRTKRWKVMNMRFPTIRHMRGAHNILGRPHVGKKRRVFVPDLGDITYAVQSWEIEVPPQAKFMDMLGIVPCGWIQLQSYTLPDLYHTHAQVEVETRMRHIAVLKEKMDIPPIMVASWDVEGYSHNGNFPNPYDVRDHVVCINTRVERYHQGKVTETRCFSHVFSKERPPGKVWLDPNKKYDATTPSTTNNDLTNSTCGTTTTNPSSSSHGDAIVVENAEQHNSSINRAQATQPVPADALPPVANHVPQQQQQQQGITTSTIHHTEVKKQEEQKKKPQIECFVYNNELACIEAWRDFMVTVIDFDSSVAFNQRNFDWRFIVSKIMIHYAMDHFTNHPDHLMPLMNELRKRLPAIHAKCKPGHIVQNIKHLYWAIYESKDFREYDGALPKQQHGHHTASTTTATAAAANSTTSSNDEIPRPSSNEAESQSSTTHLPPPSGFHQSTTFLTKQQQGHSTHANGRDTSITGAAHQVTANCPPGKKAQLPVGHGHAQVPNNSSSSTKSPVSNRRQSTTSTVRATTNITGKLRGCSASSSIIAAASSSGTKQTKKKHAKKQEKKAVPQFEYKNAPHEQSRFFQFGRLIFDATPYQRKNLTSAMFGDNEYYFVDPSGRIGDVDMFHEIKSTHKLHRYGLQDCKEAILGKDAPNKIDLGHHELFRMVRENCLEPIIVYCDGDVLIPPHMAYKENTYEKLIEMARVSITLPRDIMIRGIQIKTYNSLVRRAHELGFYCNIPPKHEMIRNNGGYQGANVFDPICGFHDMYIVVVDVTSLYPSVQDAYCLCPSTWVRSRTTKQQYQPQHHYNNNNKQQQQQQQQARVTKPPPPHCAESTTPSAAATTAVANEESSLLHNVPHKNIQTKLGNWTFVQADGKDIVCVCSTLVKENKAYRKRIKDEMDKMDKNDPRYKIYGCRELGIKFLLNGRYGFFGVEDGMCPCLPVADGVTAMGRETIMHAKRKVEEQYGDSVLVLGGDTDSLFIGLPKIAMDDPEGLKKAFVFGDEIAKYLSGLDPTGNIQFCREGIAKRGLFLKKKRYILYLHTALNDPKKPPKIVAKGVELKRRDNAATIRNIQNNLADLIFVKERADDAPRFVQEILDKLVRNQIPLEQYVITKSLKGGYKGNGNDSIPIHVHVNKKLKQRAPGTEYKSGERVAYVVIEQPEGTKKYLQGEDPSYVTAHPRQCKIDRLYYLDMFVKPVCDILEPIFEDPSRLFDKCRASLMRQRYQTMNARQFMESRSSDHGDTSPYNAHVPIIIRSSTRPDHEQTAVVQGKNRTLYETTMIHPNNRHDQSKDTLCHQQQQHDDVSMIEHYQDASLIANDAQQRDDNARCGGGDAMRTCTDKRGTKRSRPEWDEDITIQQSSCPLPSPPIQNNEPSTNLPFVSLKRRTGTFIAEHVRKERVKKGHGISKANHLMMHVDDKVLSTSATDDNLDTMMHAPPGDHFLTMGGTHYHHSNHTGASSSLHCSNTITTTMNTSEPLLNLCENDHSSVFKWAPPPPAAKRRKYRHDTTAANPSTLVTSPASMHANKMITDPIQTGNHHVQLASDHVPAAAGSGSSDFHQSTSSSLPAKRPPSSSSIKKTKKSVSIAQRTMSAASLFSK